MKLTKGKIARLHKTKRQSVKKQKWNKKHRNVKNLMSLNQKIPSHLANKSMKKYKKVGGELVQYGGELSDKTIDKIRTEIEIATHTIITTCDPHHGSLDYMETTYAEFMCQIYNQPNYNVNTLKKSSEEVIKIVDTKPLVGGGGGFITAYSDGTIKRFDVPVVAGAIWLQNPLSVIRKHDVPITALEVINTALSNVVITGDSNGKVQIYNVQTNTVTFIIVNLLDDSNKPIISIIGSVNNNNILITYCDKISETGEKQMALVSYVIATLQRDTGNLFQAIADFIKDLVTPWFTQNNLHYSTNIRCVVSNSLRTTIAICRDYVVDIVAINENGIVQPDDNSNKTLVSKFFDGFNVAGFRENGELIACGCNDILTIWNYTGEVERVTETFILKLRLPSTITSILFTNNAIYCGLKNGAIQKNTYNYVAPHDFVLTNDINHLDDLRWFVGHMDSVNSMFIDAVTNTNIYSCSDDGTIRQWAQPGVAGVSAFNSTIFNFSNNPTTLPPSPFLEITFQLLDISTYVPRVRRLETLVTVQREIRAASVIHNNAKRPGFDLDITQKMQNLRPVYLGTVNAALGTVKTQRFRTEHTLTGETDAKIADETAHLNNMITDINADSGTSENKASRIQNLTNQTDQIIQAIRNKKILEMEKIYNLFLASVQKILNEFGSVEIKRFKESFEPIKTVKLNWVYDCIFIAVDTLNKYYINYMRDSINAAVTTSITASMASFVNIKNDIKEQIKETPLPYSTFWNSLDAIELFYTNEETTTKVIMNLYDQDEGEGKRNQLLTDAKENMPKVNGTAGYLYEELLWAYDLIGIMYSKIKKYNLDTDQLGNQYKSSNLTPVEVLHILCQTDIFTNKTYQDIHDFAETFRLKVARTSSNDLSKFEEFANEQYIAVPTRKMLLSEFNKKRDKLINENTTIVNVIKKIWVNPSYVDVNLMDVVVSPSETKGFHEFKKSVYELQKLYLQNQIFYMRSLSKTFQMIPSVANIANPQTNADIDSWEKLKNILLDPSNPRSDDTFQRWFKVLRDNRVSTEKELFDMSPGALDKLKADSVWNDLKNKASGKLGFFASLNRARLNREILKKDDNGKLIDEKFLQQILDNNKNPRSIERYTELKDILNKNGFTTEGSLSLLTPEVISKLDKQIQPLMSDYLKTVNPAGSVSSKHSEDMYGLFPGNNTPGPSQPVQLDGSIIIGSDVGKQLNEDLQLQLHNGNYPRDNNGNIIVPPDADKTFVNNLKGHIQRNINTPQQGQTTSVATQNQFQQQQQPSQLTNEQIGKAAEILINEFAYKIGPIINNLPYGEQQSTNSVSQAALALVNGVRARITNVQPDVNQLSTQLIENSDASSQGLQEQIDELRNELENRKAMDKPNTSQDTSPGQSEVASREVVNLPQQSEVASQEELNDNVKFVQEMVEETNPPWVASLKASQTNKGGGQQLGGGGLQGIDDLRNVLNCYAERLQRLDIGDSNTKITKFEVNHGLVERWHKKKTGERKVNVIPVTITNTINSINDLYKSDKDLNSNVEYKNILYVKFLEVRTMNHSDFSLQNETTNSFLLVSFVCVEMSYVFNNPSYDVSSITHFQNSKTEIIDFVKRNQNITTIKFLVVNKGNKIYVQPEIHDSRVEVHFNDENIDTLTFLRETLLSLKSFNWERT